MPATPIKTSLFNATLNPYPGKRPKVVEKLYSIESMFRNFEQFSFPIELRSNGSNALKYIRIDSVLACLPGGRGCVGKERLGSKLTNRQIAIVNQKGPRFNPKFKNAKYGFLQLIGVLVFRDGSMSNINIPVETSGIIGIRSGVSDMVQMTRGNSRNKLMDLLYDIEKIVFKLTGIKKVREPRIEMINAYFNLYTDKTGTNRPKIANFKAFLKATYKNGLNEHYSMTRMPWLMTQGNPTVTKGVFKPKPDSEFSTVTISPYGRVEVLGVKSVEMLQKHYSTVVDTYQKLPIASKETYVANNNNEEVRTKRKYVKKTKVIPSVSMLNKFVLSKKGKTLFIDNKECEKYDKPVLVELAKRLQVSHRGTKKTVCNNIYDIL